MHGRVEFGAIGCSVISGSDAHNSDARIWARRVIVNSLAGGTAPRTDSPSRQEAARRSEGGEAKASPPPSARAAFSTGLSTVGICVCDGCRINGPAGPTDCRIAPMPHHSTDCPIVPWRWNRNSGRCLRRLDASLSCDLTMRFGVPPGIDLTGQHSGSPPRSAPQRSALPVRQRGGALSSPDGHLVRRTERPCTAPESDRESQRHSVAAIPPPLRSPASPRLLAGPRCRPRPLPSRVTGSRLEEVPP